MPQRMSTHAAHRDRANDGAAAGAYRVAGIDAVDSSDTLPILASCARARVCGDSSCRACVVCVCVCACVCVCVLLEAKIELARSHRTHRKHAIRLVRRGKLHSAKEEEKEKRASKFPSPANAGRLPMRNVTNGAPKCHTLAPRATPRRMRHSSLLRSNEAVTAHTRSAACLSARRSCAALTRSSKLGGMRACSVGRRSGTLAHTPPSLSSP